MQLVCADGCVIRHNPFGSWWGTIFYGTEGIVAVNRGKFAVWLGKGVDPTDGKIQKGLMDATFDGLERVAFWGVAPWDKVQEPVPGSRDKALPVWGCPYKFRCFFSGLLAYPQRIRRHDR